MQYAQDRVPTLFPGQPVGPNLAFGAACKVLCEESGKRRVRAKCEFQFYYFCL